MTTVEQSYALPRIARPVRARLWVLAVAMFTVGTNAFVIAGVLPDLARSFGRTTAVVSTAITAYAAIVAIASPLVATFLARVPRRPLLAAGMALVSVGIAVTALAGSVEVFIVGRIVAALGGAALVPPATAVAPALVDPRQRGRAIAIVTFGFSGAVALGAPLGTALAAAFGWRAALGGIAALGFVLTVVIAATMAGLPRVDGGRLTARFAVLADRRILLVLLAMVGYTLSFNALYIFSAEVLAPAVERPAGVLAAVLLAFGLATLVGTWLGGRFVDRLGGLRVAVLGFAAMAVVYAALESSTAFLPGAILLYAVWGVVGMPPQVGLQELLVRANPREAGVSLSWYSTAMYIGIALAPIVGSAALGVGRWAVPLAALASVLVALALVVAGRRTKTPA
jgi:DHA1 family purine base/nucleoside efflux pump-like MFS transporter